MVFAFAVASQSSYPFCMGMLLLIHIILSQIDNLKKSVLEQKKI